MIDPGLWDAFVARSLNGTLFHTQRFLAYHPAGRFEWDHARLGAADELALFPAASWQGGETWWSGAGASFGGPVLPARADERHARAALRALIEEAAQRGYRRVRTRPPPPLYEEGERGLLRAALLESGFRLVASEIFEAAPLRGREPLSLLAPAARRGAAKAEREGICVREEVDYRAFHELLARDRAAKGGTPVHSAEELEDLARRLGSDHVLLLARHESRLVAGAWLLRANPRVALSFYVCQDREYRRLRATNLLLLRALEWAAARSVAHLDYGTSSIGGRPNRGLSEFKRAHGGRAYVREVFEREIP